MLPRGEDDLDRERTAPAFARAVGQDLRRYQRRLARPLLERLSDPCLGLPVDTRRVDQVASLLQVGQHGSHRRAPIDRPERAGDTPAAEPDLETGRPREAVIMDGEAI